VTATADAAARPAESALRSDTPVLGAFAVALAEGAAAFLAACSLLLLTVGHTENVEFALYLVGFCGALPLSLASALWRRGSLTPGELGALGSLDAAALALVLGVGRLVDAGPRAFLLAGVAVLALSELAAGQFRRALAVASARALGFGWLVVPLFVVAALAFLPSSTYDSRGFWLAFPVALLLAALGAGAGVLSPHRPAVVVDVVAILLIAATVCDVFFWDGWMIDNHNYYLGPVNELLHGRVLLVDVFAQYGVGVIYLLAGLFSLIPIGYGTFALVLSALTVIEFALIYAVVRIAGRSQPIAILATAVAIVFVIYGQIQSFVAYPSTGPLRFALPYVVILLEVLSARSTTSTRSFRQASVAVTALASLWSFETFAYTLAAFLAISAFGAVADREAVGDVARRRLLPLVGLVALFQVLFAVGTRAASGGWPRWGTYLDYIRLYSVQGFYTLPVTPWSPGFLLAGTCFASALLLALVAVRWPDLVLVRRDLFVALAGSTAFAILAFTYFVGRSHPNNLHHVAPPAILACALWLCLLAEQRVRFVPALRLALFAVAVWSAFMLVDGSRGELEAKWTHSALGTLVADGPSALGDRISFLAGRPAIIPQAPDAVLLLRVFDPGSSRSLVLLEPEVTTEVLLRANRGNALPIATPPQDIVLPAAVRHVLAAVPRLRPGTIMLADSRYLAAAPASDPNPSLTELAVWQVRRFFTVRTLAESRGLVVAQLEH
jgi:hypothetical protein